MSMQSKKKRIEDPALLRTYHDKRCLLCFCQGEPSHIKSKGAGGDDVDWNLVPLCRKHHTELHSSGQWTFAQKYELYKKHLEWLGWAWQGTNLTHRNLIYH